MNKLKKIISEYKTFKVKFPGEKNICLETKKFDYLINELDNYIIKKEKQKEDIERIKLSFEWGKKNLDSGISNLDDEDINILFNFLKR